MFHQQIYYFNWPRCFLVTTLPSGSYLTPNNFLGRLVVIHIKIFPTKINKFRVEPNYSWRNLRYPTLETHTPGDTAAITKLFTQGLHSSRFVQSTLNSWSMPQALGTLFLRTFLANSRFPFKLSISPIEPYEVDMGSKPGRTVMEFGHSMAHVCHCTERWGFKWWKCSKTLRSAMLYKFVDCEPLPYKIV